MAENNTSLTPKIQPLHGNPRLRKVSKSSPLSAFRSPVIISQSPASNGQSDSPSHEQASKRFCSDDSPKSCKSDLAASSNIPKWSYSGCRQKLARAFKSPLIGQNQARFMDTHSGKSDKTEGTPGPSKAESLEQLKLKHETLKKEIQELQQQGCKIEDLGWYIDKFHEYNEIKDLAQKVMGRIAEIEGKTVKEVHEEFDIYENG